MSEPENILEIWLNKDIEPNIQKLTWAGRHVPWSVASVDIQADWYQGYTVTVFFVHGGEMTLYPLTITWHDITPKRPQCGSCGQDLPRNHEPVFNDGMP